MKTSIIPFIGLALIVAPVFVFADPPRGTLSEVEIHTASGTIRGHITFGWQDVPSADEYLSGKDYADAGSLQEITKQRGAVQLMLDLKRVSVPRPMYVFSSEKTIPSAAVERIAPVPGTAGTRVPSEEGVVKIDPALVPLIDKKPVYQCWQENRNPGNRAVVWLSYNDKAGETKLKDECSGEKVFENMPKSGISQSGTHPKLKGVFWFSFWTD